MKRIAAGLMLVMMWMLSGVVWGEDINSGDKSTYEEVRDHIPPDRIEDIDDERRDMAVAPSPYTTKWGIKMAGFADVVVCWWFLPLVLYIVVSLITLCCWLVGRALSL